MMSVLRTVTHEVHDREGSIISEGDELIFLSSGMLERGRCVRPQLEGVFGAVLVQSLFDPTRTALAVPDCCVVVRKADQKEPT